MSKRPAALESWRALRGLCAIRRVTRKSIADQIGVSKQRVSYVLCTGRASSAMLERVRDAVAHILAARGTSPGGRSASDITPAGETGNE